MMSWLISNPVASPLSSMPFKWFSAITLVISLLAGPVEVTSMPSAPLPRLVNVSNGAIPAKVLKTTVPVTVSRSSTPF